ncbi:MAG: cytidylyltransferase domain-containing protein [Flavobacterium sp.]
MRILAIIPARSGSKGVPGKNAYLLDGRSLIQHAVDCALKSNNVTKIVVTSDSNELLDIVENNEKVIKLLRPAHLASDDSNIIDSIDHVISLFSDFEYLILLQPTSPLRTSLDIDCIVEEFRHDDSVEGVISVVPLSDMHPSRMYFTNEKLNLISLNQEEEFVRRQDLKNVYFRNGCFYMVKTKAFIEQKTLMPKVKKAYIMKEEWLLNIDSLRDIKVLNLIYDEWKNEIGNYRK